MKKLVIILAIVVTILAINKEEKIVIPKEAIRFRVIANSNEEQDQTIKKKVVDNLNGEIRKLTVLDNTLENSRKNIKNKIPEFSQVVKETLDKKMPLDIIAIFMKDILEDLAEITGEEVTEDIIDKIFLKTSTSSFYLGKLSYNNKVNYYVNGNAFFSKHIGVVGSTGSGKSCAVAKVIQEACGIKKSRNENKDSQKSTD